MTPGEREELREEIAFAQAQQIVAHAWSLLGCEQALDLYADAVATQFHERIAALEAENARLREAAAWAQHNADARREWHDAETAWLAAWDAEYRAQVTCAPLVELLRRAAVGLQRHCDGHAPMRIPADNYSDSDIVLDDIRAALLAAYEAQR